MLSSSRANVQQRGSHAAHSARDDMLPETRVLLSSFYQPYNDELAALMSDVRFRWSEAARGPTS